MLPGPYSSSILFNRTGEVNVVGDRLIPIDGLAIQRFLDSHVLHGGFVRRAVPVATSAVTPDDIAVPITPRMRLVTVASPEYLARYSIPQLPEELTSHRCINLRLPTRGGLYSWEFGSGDNEFWVRVSGPLIMNSVLQILQASLEGIGLAHLPDNLVQSHLDSRALVGVVRAF